VFYQADGTIFNGYITIVDIIDCCDINWKPHTQPLGFLAYNADLHPLSTFYWGENYYNIADNKETEWSADQSGSGIGKIDYQTAKAIDSFSNGDLVILEGSPEFAIERWAISGSATYKYGTGGQGDADELFNHPRDVTVDSQDYVYVLDILSNGEPRIKVFDNKLEPVTGIGDSTLIPGMPISCDWDDDNNALHVLHSQGVVVIYK
jgi:hypothetical protein